MSSKQTIIKLRQQTGAPISAIKEALSEAGGDEQKAIALLRQKGQNILSKRESRQAGEGWVGSYVHSNGKLAALVKLNCETDFVARSKEFQSLAHDLAMQVAATNPTYLRAKDVPQEAVVDASEVCLESQKFIKDESKHVLELLAESAAKMGEKIEVGGFVRMEV